MRARGDGGSGGEGGEVRGRAETIFLRWSFKQVEESEVEGRAEGDVCEKHLYEMTSSVRSSRFVVNHRICL